MRTVPLAADGTKKADIPAQLNAQGLDGLMLTSPENVTYVAGLPSLPSCGNPILHLLKNVLPSFAFTSSDSQPAMFRWIGAAPGVNFKDARSYAFVNWASAVDQLGNLLNRRCLKGQARG